MRNLVIDDDISVSLQVDNASIVGLEKDDGSDQYILLTSNGKLHFVQDLSLSLESKPIDIIVEEQIVSNNWFSITIISETINFLVCISHDGAIVKGDLSNGSVTNFVLEGEVDGGIAAAQWSPDRSILAIVTNVDTALLMTSYFDLINEIPVPAHKLDVGVSLSWRGDGSFFGLITHDILPEGDLVRLHLYAKDGTYHGVGRNVGDGLAARVLGLFPSAVAYSPNGSLIAAPLQKTPTRLQIAFFEPNGLRHGEFDLQVRISISMYVPQSIMEHLLLIDILPYLLMCIALCIIFALYLIYSCQLRASTMSQPFTGTLPLLY